MSDVASALPRWQGKTLWARDRAAPLRDFVRTEAASALVLVAGIVAAIVWANVSDRSYESFWHTRFYLGVGSAGISQDFRTWLNSGLMTLFFLVVGLETRRELDLGDLRERRRFVLPVLTGLTGMAIPIAIYLAFNAGRPGAHGWGVAMSTDTALALGLLALFGREVPDRMRVFVLTVFVVDDLGALLVIAFVYSGKIVVMPLGARLLLGDTRLIQDLIPAVDPDHDHTRGPRQAVLTVIEFGDFECPYCGQAEPVVRDILTDTSIRYIWRHLPLTDVHPRAQIAAEAAEAAAAQDAFWPMHDVLLQHQDALTMTDLTGYARSLGLDVEKFRDDLERHTFATRVDQDVESADLSGVSGTPTFFINGQRHYGTFDLPTLTEAIRTARERAITGTDPDWAPDWAPDEVDPGDYAEEPA